MVILCVVPQECCSFNSSCYNCIVQTLCALPLIQVIAIVKPTIATLHGPYLRYTLSDCNALMLSIHRRQYIPCVYVVYDKHSFCVLSWYKLSNSSNMIMVCSPLWVAERIPHILLVCLQQIGTAQSGSHTLRREWRIPQRHWLQVQKHGLRAIHLSRRVQ